MAPEGTRTGAATSGPNKQLGNAEVLKDTSAGLQRQGPHSAGHSLLRLGTVHSHNQAEPESSAGGPRVLDACRVQVCTQACTPACTYPTCHPQTWLTWDLLSGGWMTHVSTQKDANTTGHWSDASMAAKTSLIPELLPGPQAWCSVNLAHLSLPPHGQTSINQSLRMRKTAPNCRQRKGTMLGQRRRFTLC